MITTIEKMRQELMYKDKTPAYLFYEDKFASNIKMLRNSFRRYYRNYNLAYSYKTNNHEIICRSALSKGCYAEVVSPTEYNLAKRIGVPDCKIIYNGILPDYENKYNCAKNGGKVNIDNLHELTQLDRYAKEQNECIAVGIRCFFPIDETDSSKFGFDISGNEFKYLIENRFEHLKIIGLHCHISNHRDVASWEKRIKKMSCISSLFNIKYIDLGGNMYGNMEKELRNQFNSVASYEDYARVVGTIMKNIFPDEHVELITENGTSTIGNCVSILSKIVGKKMSCGLLKYVCDTSYYDCGFLIKTKDIPCEVISMTESESKQAAIVGYACTEEDFIKKKYVGKIEIGDLLLLKNLGAYSYSIAPMFIQGKHLMYKISI